MTILGYSPGQIRKAINGAIVGGAAPLAAALTDLHLSRLEAGTVLGGAILGFVAVFRTRNAPAAKPLGDRYDNQD